MRTPKSYRFSPSTLQILDMLKSEKRFENCTETEIIEIAIFSLYANGNGGQEGD